MTLKQKLSARLPWLTHYRPAHTKESRKKPKPQIFGEMRNSWRNEKLMSDYTTVKCGTHPFSSKKRTAEGRISVSYVTTWYARAWAGHDVTRTSSIGSCLEISLLLLLRTFATGIKHQAFEHEYSYHRLYVHTLDISTWMVSSPTGLQRENATTRNGLQEQRVGRISPLTTQVRRAKRAESTLPAKGGPPKNENTVPVSPHAKILPIDVWKPKTIG